ncbi:MAG: Fur family transcriptional regulator [Roseovarius sp.]
MIGFEAHDHRRCIAAALSAAEAHCAAAGLNLTPVRRRVLEILLRRHRALGAYEILDELREAGFGSQPPVVYRALEFLVANGFAHRIERLNAFVACAHAGAEHAPAFLVCRLCAAVAEAEAAAGQRAIAATARAEGFTVERMVIEAVGLCPRCAGAAP